MCIRDRPLVRRMPVSAIWHIMAALLDGHIMQLEGTLLAELFLFNDLLNTARNCIICLCSFKLAYYVSYMLKQNLICVFSWCRLPKHINLDYIHCEPKKTPKCFCHIFHKMQSILIKFGNIVLNKFVIQWFKCFPAHLNSVAALLCET